MNYQTIPYINKISSMHEQKEFLSKILTTTIDFIGYAVSPWHAVGVDAAIFYLSKLLRKKPRGVIFITPHLKDGLLINEDNFVAPKYSDVMFVNRSLHVFDNFKIDKREKFISRVINKHCYFKKMYALRKFKWEDKMPLRKLYIVASKSASVDNLLLLNEIGMLVKYMVSFITYDEGAGTYASDKLWSMVMAKDSNKRFNILTCITYYFKRKIKYIFSKKILRMFNEIDIRLFSKIDGDILINKVGISTYREILRMRSDNISSSLNFATKANRGIALIITQPLSEYGIISKQEERKFLELITFTLKKYKYDVFLKLHPREEISKFVSFGNIAQIISIHNRPVEEMISSLKPSVVIGYTSTALITSRVLFSIKAISVADMVMKNCKDTLGEESIKQFKQLFGNIIKCTGNLSDLESVISNDY